MSSPQVKKRPQYGGWNENSPRKHPMDKMVALTVMVTKSEYTKALIHLRNEAQKFRKPTNRKIRSPKGLLLND